MVDEDVERLENDGNSALRRSARGSEFDDKVLSVSFDILAPFPETATT